MFDMSWSELLLIAVVALIAIGPKDLPKVLKTFAQFSRKAKSLARDFQSGIEEIAREAELHEVKQHIERSVNTDIGQTIERTIDPEGSVAKSLDLQAQGAASVPGVQAPTQTPEEKAGEAGAASEAHPATPSGEAAAALKEAVPFESAERKPEDAGASTPAKP